MKKSLIVISTFVILSFFFSSPSFAVCIMPPGYDPADDPDINLDLSGWEPIVDDPLFDQFPFDHPTDPNAPQLSTLIPGMENCDLDVTSVNMISGTDRPPNVPADYANLVCLSTPAGAPILVPNSGYNMGGGCEAAVLYTTPNSIVLKYTPDDNIVSGYTIYLHNFQVDSGLLAYYNEHRGSGSAPCLSGGERIGVSSGVTCVAIRDTGTFMDPRWQEWWNQCPASALVLFLKLIDLCTGELPSPGLCPAPFPQPDSCCPIKSGGAEGWLFDLLAKLGGNVVALFDWFVDITFTLKTATPDLARSWQLQYDADYFWASNPRYDPRRIPLPDEEPEAGMWPGAALRVAPPDYRPSWMWEDHRDRELKWVIPLDQYGVDNWHGRSEAFHPLATGAVDLWEWLIKTPATEEIVATARSSPSASLPQSSPGQVGITPLTPSGPATPKPAFFGDNPNPSQTLGTQLALNEEEYCVSVSVNCSIANWEATCSVYGDCSQNCGHVHIESVPKDVHGTRCDHTGPKCQVGAGGPCRYSIPHNQTTFSVTFKNRGDHDGCTATVTCETTLDDGNGSCSASSGDVCGGSIVSGVDVCHPPWVEAPEVVCSVLGNREITTEDALRLLFKKYMGGGVSFFPLFPRIEEIAHRLAGTLTERYRAYREVGIGGVFDAFLPPGTTPPEQQKFPTLDANAEFTPYLNIHIELPCVLPMDWACEYTYKCCSEGPGGWGCRNADWCDAETNAGCDPGETCEVSESCKCCFLGNPNLWCRQEFDKDLPLKTQGEDMELIDDVGSQTEALRQTQQWLTPPL